MKFILDMADDALLDYIADNGNRMVLCEGPPSDGEGASIPVTDSPGVMLASVPLATGDGGGSYTISDGDVSGRKLTVARQDAVAVSFAGVVDHIAIINDDPSAPELLLVTSISNAQAVTAGQLVDVDAFDHEVADPV